MANALYSKGKEAILGSVDMSADNIKTVLVDKDASTGYTPNLASDQFLSAIVAGCRVATSGNLSTKTLTGGVFDADDVTLTAVSGGQSEYVVGYKDTGVAGTSPLLWYIDTATGLPVTPGGGDIQIVWDNGASKIFAL